MGEEVGPRSPGTGGDATPPPSKATWKGGGDSSVVGYPPSALWVAGSSLARVSSLDGSRRIDPGHEDLNWVTAASGN